MRLRERRRLCVLYECDITVATRCGGGGLEKKVAVMMASGMLPVVVVVELPQAPEDDPQKR